MALLKYDLEEKVAKNSVRLSVFDLMSQRNKLLRCHLRAAFYRAGIHGLVAKIIDTIIDEGFEKAEKEYMDDVLEKHHLKLFKRMQKKVYVV